MNKYKIETYMRGFGGGHHPQEKKKKTKTKTKTKKP